MRNRYVATGEVVERRICVKLLGNPTDFSPYDLKVNEATTKRVE